MLSDVSVVDVGQSIAEKFGEVRAQLLDQGHTIASIDLFIAASALIHGMTVVTHNTQHFSKVPALNVADRLQP